MTRFLAGVLALVCAAPLAAAEMAAGNWRVSQHLTALADARICVLKVEMKDGKPTATVVDTLEQPPLKKGGEPRKLEVKLLEFKVEKNHVLIVLSIANSKSTFEGVIDAKDVKVIRGSIGDNNRVMRGTLTAQDGEKLEVATAASRPKEPEPFAAAQKLTRAPLLLQSQALRTTDANEKAEILEKLKDARKEADEKVPGLYRETIAKHSDSSYAIESAMQLLRAAARNKASAQDVIDWKEVVKKDAARYGDRFRIEMFTQVAEMLNNQKGYEVVALGAATEGAAQIKESTPAGVQSRILKALKTAQLANKLDNDVKETDIKLVKIENALDDEYVKSVPPFKPEVFAGRKNKSANRVAVMELFTGATCPPCVAADAAFDALMMAYKPKDLVLIQYHMHIPGPDTLTNPDTIARWDYYRDKFGMEIRGVPSSLFNGKPVHGGGGGMANSEMKFNQYTGTINDLLEGKSDVSLTGTAKRTGDKIKADVAVEAKEPGENLKLRVLLVEEKVKYPGSNGMRFHHQVVRAMPGGKDGTAVTEKTLKKPIEIDLAEVRKGLTKYLDEFAATRPFPNPERPMAMSHLSIIALVQNDATGEILNAAQFPVEGK